MIELHPDRHAVDVAHEEAVEVNADGIESPTGYKFKHPIGGLIAHPDGRVSMLVLGRALNEQGEWVGAWLNHSRNTVDGSGRTDCEGYIDFSEHGPQFTVVDDAGGEVAGLTFDDEIVCTAEGCGLHGYLKRGAWWQDAAASDDGSRAAASLLSKVGAAGCW